MAGRGQESAFFSLAASRLQSLSSTTSQFLFAPSFPFVNTLYGQCHGTSRKPTNSQPRRPTLVAPVRSVPCARLGLPKPAGASDCATALCHCGGAGCLVSSRFVSLQRGTAAGRLFLIKHSLGARVCQMMARRKRRQEGNESIWLSSTR